MPKSSEEEYRMFDDELNKKAHEEHKRLAEAQVEEEQRSAERMALTEATLGEVGDSGSEESIAYWKMVEVKRNNDAKDAVERQLTTTRGAVVTSRLVDQAIIDAEAQGVHIKLSDAKQ